MTRQTQPIWSQFRLRTRILLSYLLILGLMIGPALHLIGSMRDLADTIGAHNRKIAADAAQNARLAGGIAELQLAVNTYLIQPSPENQAQVNATIVALSAQVAKARKEATEAELLQRLREINATLFAYEQSFQALVSLLNRQEQSRARISEGLIAVGGELAELSVALDAADGLSVATAAQMIAVGHTLQRATLLAASLEGDEAKARADQVRALLADASGGLTALAIPEPQAEAQRLIIQRLNRIDLDIGAYATNLPLEQTYTEQLIGKGDDIQAISAGLDQITLADLAESATQIAVESDRAQRVGYSALGITLIVALALGLWLARTITRPIRRVMEAIQQVGQGAAAVVATDDQSEVGQLAQAFNAMSADLQHERAALRRQQEVLEERNGDLERALAEIRSADAAREALRSTVRSLSVPVLPILDGVIHMPLVGEIDEDRAALIVDRLLGGIETHRARQVILDITGVPLIDSGIAQWLGQAIASARLLGARCVLVGVTPEVAQTLVSAQIDFSGIPVQADLRSAVSQVMGRAHGLGPGKPIADR